MKSENYQSSTACLVLKRSDRLVCRNAFGSETNEENCSKFFDGADCGGVKSILVPLRLRGCYDTAEETQGWRG